MTRHRLRALLAYADRAGIFPTFSGGDMDKAPCGPAVAPDLSPDRAGAAVGRLVCALRLRPTSVEEIVSWWGSEATLGVGLNCGGVGGFQCIDFDDPAAFHEWLSLIVDRGFGWALSLTARASTRHGFHVWARVPECRDGSLKLASHASKVWDERRGKETLTRIETRGRGGYALIYPSPGYAWLDKTPLDVPDMTLEVWSALIAAAKALNLAPQIELASTPARPKQTDAIESPGDWYNRTADWPSLMARAGGKPCGKGGGKPAYWRPGKSRGTLSATTGNITRHGNDAAKIHTPNWPPFEQGANYTKFGFYALLEHGGDFRAAAAAVQRLPGYTGVRRAA